MVRDSAGFHVQPGARLSINVGGRFGTKATHEVVGFEGDWISICPIEKLDEITPGQRHVPVSRITGERILIHRT